MTQDNDTSGPGNNSDSVVSRRPFIKAFGASALVTGLAGCSSTGGNGNGGNGNGGNGNGGNGNDGNGNGNATGGNGNGNATGGNGNGNDTGGNGNGNDTGGNGNGNDTGGNESSGDGGSTGTTEGGNLEEVSMTLASTFAEGHVLVAGAATRFKEIMEEESDGNFTVQISPGGAYGAEDEISELVAEGGVEGHSQGTFPFLQYAPEYFFFANPFVMDDFDHILRLHDSDLMSDGYDQIMENGNQRPVGNMVYRGARHLCTKEDTGAVTTPDDIQGLTLRVSEIPPWVQIFGEIGFDTTAIAWTEVYSAMQTGTAEAIEAPPGALNSARLFEVFDVLNITAHQITTGNIYLNEDFYQGLDETYQDLVNQAGQEATDYASQMAQDEEQGHIDTFESENGITINQDADRASFASAAEPAIQNLFDEEWAHSWEDVRNV